MRPVILFAQAGQTTLYCDRPCYDATQTVADCICHGENYGKGYAQAIAQNKRSREDILNRWIEYHAANTPAVAFIQLPNNLFITATAT